MNVVVVLLIACVDFKYANKYSNVAHARFYLSNIRRIFYLRTSHLNRIHLNRIHSQCRIQLRIRVRVPRRLPLLSTIPEVSQRIRGSILPRLTAHIVGEEAVCAARCHVQNKIELPVERSVQTAFRPRIVTGESTALEVTIFGIYSADLFAVQTELQVICVKP